MAVSDLDTLISAAKTAIAASDWTTAENKLMQAQAELAGLPNGKAGDEEVQYRHRTIDDLLANVRRKAAASANSGAGIQRHNVEYQRPGVSQLTVT